MVMTFIFLADTLMRRSHSWQNSSLVAAAAVNRGDRFPLLLTRSSAFAGKPRDVTYCLELE